MGVEVKVFENLDNVIIAKDSITAIHTMNAVVQEMQRRFVYLEANGSPKLIPSATSLTE